MIKRVSALAASMVVLSSVAMAQDKPATQHDQSQQTSTQQNKQTMKVDGEFYTSANKTDFLANNLIGKRIYATEKTVDTDQAVDKASSDWNDIGEVNNILLSRDGKVKALVLGVGGFIGIGEKDVAVKMSDVKFVKKKGDDDSDYFIVVHGTKKSLKHAPTFKHKS